MDVQDVRTLIDFHYWARDRMLNAVEPLSPEQFTRNMGNSFGSVRDTIAHIYGAEWIWLSRWRGESPAALPAPEIFPDVASARAAWREHEAKMRGFFGPLDQDALNRVIEFKSMAGSPMAGILCQMLQHVVNHASYHRGQVTTLLRQLGAAPPASTDLMTFYRERNAMAG
jgi:uncharacterized damage-inducible protein DinB